MEAATPLRVPRVHVLMGRVIVENVVVDDPATAAFVDRRMAAGEDPADVVVSAVEVGARVLEREQAAVDAEFVRNEFEKVSREVETAFSERARVVAEFFGTKVDEVFGAENGHLARELHRLFGEGSSVGRATSVARGDARPVGSHARGPAAPVLLAPTAPTRSPTSRPPTCARRARRPCAPRPSSRGCASRWSR